jgi:PAS domain S-box-containing protein
VLSVLRKHYKISSEPGELHHDEDRKEHLTNNNEILKISTDSPHILIEEVQAQLFTILDSIDALIYVSDMDTYELLYLNKYGRNLYGAVMGQKCYEVITRGQRGICPFCTNNLLNTIEDTQLHFWEFHEICSGRWYECKDRTIRWSDGRQVRLEIATDITERKESEEALIQKEFAIESSSNGIAIADLEGIITYVNPAFLKIWGFERDKDIIGNSGFMLFKDKKQTQEIYRAIHETGEWSGDLNSLRTDATDIIVSVSANLIHNSAGDKTGVFASFNDITRQKEMERDLMESETALKRKLDVILSLKGDIGTLNLTDIIDAPEIQHLMDKFFSLTHIGVAIIDLQGAVLVATGWQDICTKFHRVNPETCKNCIESDIHLSVGVPVGTFRLYRCKNNMWDIATPIVINDVHLGNLFLGQFLFDDEEPDIVAFKQQAHKYGFDEEEYIAALKKVPRWSKETVNTVMEYYTRLVHLISKVSWNNIRLAQTLTERDTLIKRVQKNEEELQIALKKFQTLFEVFPLGISITDSSGKIIEANTESERLLGISKKEHTSRHYDEKKWIIIRPDGTLMPSEEYAATRAEKEGKLIKDVEMGMVKKDGEIIWMSVSAAPIPLEQFGVVMAFGDITQRVKNQAILKKTNEELFSLTEELNERDEELREQIDEIIQAKQEWEQIFQAIGNPAVILDNEQRIINANESILSLSGKTFDKLKNTPCWKIFHGPDVTGPPDNCPFQKLRLSKHLETSEIEIETLGEVFLISCTPIFSVSGDLDRVIHIATNITEKKRAEDALHQATHKLRLLTGLTRHDIMNQLLIMQSFHEFALEISDPDQMHSYISHAHESGVRIERMIGFTRIYEGFGTISSDWLCTFWIVEAAKTEISLGNACVKNEIPKNFEIFADPIIRKVFVTLMENAIRHGEKVTTILFTCYQRDDTWIIAIKDNGIGIPNAEKEAIFEHGYGKNTGIGLFLTREMLSITGLLIRERGEEGYGALFEIEIPKGKFRFR